MDSEQRMADETTAPKDEICERHLYHESKCPPVSLVQRREGSKGFFSAIAEIYHRRHRPGNIRFKRWVKPVAVNPSAVLQYRHRDHTRNNRRSGETSRSRSKRLTGTESSARRIAA